MLWNTRISILLEKGEYFQRDLKNLSELFDYDLFKTAYEEKKSDADNLIVQWAKALTIEEFFTQKEKD